jgi:hypothetical protein
MKISFFAKLLAAGGILTIVAWEAAPVTAADTCIVTNVAKHIRKCPPGVSYAGGSSGSGDIDATVEPVAGPPETCIKTNVRLHVRRCPVE